MINMAKTPTEVDLKVNFGLIIRPGDTLLVRMSGPLSMETAARVKSGLQELLPDLEDVVLIQAEELAVYRPESQEG
jgi:hypothetical protein